MDANKLAIERATWIVLLKQELKGEGYTFREHLNDFKTFLIVAHERSPGWWLKLSVCSAHGARNRVELDEKVFSYSCKGTMRTKLMTVLKGSRDKFDQSPATRALSAKEKEAAEWMALQEQELAGLPELKGVDVQIIRSGPYTRQYRVTLQPGNPLEHLTLDQFKALHALLQECGR